VHGRPRCGGIPKYASASSPPLRFPFAGKQKNTWPSRQVSTKGRFGVLCKTTDRRMPIEACREADSVEAAGRLLASGLLRDAVFPGLNPVTTPDWHPSYSSAPAPDSHRLPFPAAHL